jgi:hypothetical protein
MTEPTKNAKYFGTYAVRNIGRVQGIQIPAVFSGEYSVFSDDNGKTILLVKQGEKE